MLHQNLVYFYTKVYIFKVFDYLINNEGLNFK